MSEKTEKKKTLLSLLSDLVDAIHESTAENRRMRGVWERASKQRKVKKVLTENAERSEGD